MANISKPAPNLTTRANEDEVATPNRYKELTDEIEKLVSLPLPPPAEKHLLREKLAQLEYHRLGESAHYEGEKRWQFARAFALKMVPQRLESYPMHLRETTMSIMKRGEYLKLYGQRATLANMRREIDALAEIPGSEAVCQVRRLELVRLAFELTRAMDPTEVRTDERLMHLARHFAGVP